MEICIKLKFQLIIMITVLLACEKTSQNSSQELQEETEPAEEIAKSEEKEPNLSEFYEMTVPRPEKICGEVGFKYLFEGFLVPECGVCHYSKNIYNVSVFAEKNNFDLSFETISSGKVDIDTFKKMTRKNPLCIKCNLNLGDPLVDDIEEFWKNPKMCPI